MTSSCNLVRPSDVTKRIRRATKQLSSTALKGLRDGIAFLHWSLSFHRMRNRRFSGRSRLDLGKAQEQKVGRIAFPQKMPGVKSASISPSSAGRRTRISGNRF